MVPAVATRVLKAIWFQKWRIHRCVRPEAFGGIHHRSDQVESMKPGEEVAIRFLKEEKMTLNEHFKGWTLTKLDSTTILIRATIQTFT